MNFSHNISSTISSIENELNLLSEEKRLNVQRSRAEELRDVLDLLKKAQERLSQVQNDYRPMDVHHPNISNVS